MTPDQLQDAIDEAHHFLDRARDLQETQPDAPARGYYDGGRSVAAVKRASLDLSATLVALRQRR